MVGFGGAFAQTCNLIELPAYLFNHVPSSTSYSAHSHGTEHIGQHRANQDAGKNFRVGYIDVVDALLTKGCDVCKRKGTKSALHIAAEKYLVDIVEMLLQHDRDLMSLNNTDNIGMVRYVHSLLHMTDARNRSHLEKFLSDVIGTHACTH